MSSDRSRAGGPPPPGKGEAGSAQGDGTVQQAPEPRKGMPDPKLDEATFRQRFLSRYVDPAFDTLRTELDHIARVAWEQYANHKKAPRTQKAGSGYADPDYDLSVDWIAAKDAIAQAQARRDAPDGPCRVLVINGSSRSEHTCPGEMSKSYRLAQIAEAALTEQGIHVELLDLSRVTSEFGLTIHPCKACFSTAPPLCHWPCSCYPNYALGQVHDWMNDIYPLWVEAHGVLIITPVNWYQVSSPVKAMMDRLVCADGGNPDPTLTQGKKAKLAKEIELKGWDYPKHLKDRVFSVIVHGDAEGCENVRRSLSDWLRFMDLVPAGVNAELDRYIGYFEPYATSHDALDKDHAIQEEVRNAALTLAEAAKARHAGKLIMAGQGLKSPRQK